MPPKSLSERWSPGTPGGSRFRLTITQKKAVTGSLLILPGLVLVVLLIGYPFVYAVDLAFRDLYLVKGVDSATWVGLENFRTFFRDPSTKSVILNTVRYVGFSLISQFLVGLGLAVLLHREFKGRGVMRAAALIPWVMPTLVATIVWRFILDGSWGILNYSMLGLGVIDKPVNWLADKNVVWWSLIFVSLWRHFPFWYVNLLAGLQVIPDELYEVAKIDGASAIKSFWYITLPLLRPVIVVLFLLETIWRSNEFTTIWTLTKGGPGKLTMTMAPLVYQQSFGFYKLGYASSISLLLTLAMLVFTVIYISRIRLDI